VAEASRGVVLFKDLTTSTQPLHTEKEVLLSIGVYSYTAGVGAATPSFDYTYSYEPARYIVYELSELGDVELAKLLDEIADRIGKKIDVYMLTRIVDEGRKER
jgi:hypothetical protein